MKLLILPNIEDEFLKHKILDELPQTAEGKQIMTVEPKFIPSTPIEVNIDDTLMSIRFVDCVGEILENSEGYGTVEEPRLVKTPWYSEPIPFKEANKLAKELEEKYNVNVVCLSALNMTMDDAKNIILKALEEFPIKDLEILVPDYINALESDISLKNDIMESIKAVEMKYTKIKDVKSICDELELTGIYNKVNLDLLDISTGDAKIVLELDEEVYKKIVNELLGDACNSKKDFISYLYKSKNANMVFEDLNTAILQAKETGYGVSVPKVKDMKLIKPEIVKKNGLYGVKLSAKATTLHVVAVDVEASFTPIIGSLDQSNMLMNSLNENGEEDDIWEKEFFGKKLADIVNDSMKSKIVNLPDKSKDKVKTVLERLMNSNHNNLIAIII